MAIILGKKLNMSQKFAADGTVVPLTVIEAGPCEVTQVRTADKDGYQAVCLSFGKDKKEFRLSAEAKKGDKFTVEQFKEGDEVKVTGISKGKGFQGVVRRHGFAGSLASHGHKDQLRMPGSIGSVGPQRVFKGTRMAGQMGNKKISVLNLKVVEIDKEKNLIYLKGAVPGARNSLLMIQSNA